MRAVGRSSKPLSTSAGAIQLAVQQGFGIMINRVSQDGELYYLPGFISQTEAQLLFERLQTELVWRGEEITIAGRRVKVPRLVCWYGDEGAVYRYSGVAHDPLPWPDILRRLKRMIEAVCGRVFNSVLGNLYRDGRDSMGWHADKERELGENPYIASLSLGEERLFKVRHNTTGECVDILLASGSLLLMGGCLQHHWRHCVPKASEAKAARINLTFRNIVRPA
jgi:alkylated DNA repair dioxygenase AlkB